MNFINMAPVKCDKAVINRTEQGKYELACLKLTGGKILTQSHTLPLGGYPTAYACNHHLFYRDNDALYMLKSGKPHLLTSAFSSSFHINHVSSPKTVILISVECEGQPQIVSIQGASEKLHNLAYHHNTSRLGGYDMFRGHHYDFHDGRLLSISHIHGQHLAYEMAGNGPYTNTHFMFSLGSASIARFLDHNHAVFLSYVICGFVAICLHIETRTPIWTIHIPGNFKNALALSGQNAIVLTDTGVVILPRNTRLMIPEEFGKPLDFCLDKDMMVASVLTTNGIVEIDLD